MEKFIFKNFSMTINKNQKIGIIGESGSGKSTLINLFLGLLSSQKGTINLLDKKEFFII